MKKVIAILALGVTLAFCNTPSETEQTVADSSRMSMDTTPSMGTDTSGTMMPDTTRPVPDTMRPDSIRRGN